MHIHEDITTMIDEEVIERPLPLLGVGKEHVQMLLNKASARDMGLKIPVRSSGHCGKFALSTITAKGESPEILMWIPGYKATIVHRGIGYILEGDAPIAAFARWVTAANADIEGCGHPEDCHFRMGSRQ